MAWIESRKKQSGGGGAEFDVLINYALYSSVSPNQFYSINLPTNYLDYDLLAFACVQADVDHDVFNSSAPRTSTEMLYIKPSDISSTTVNLQTGVFNSSATKISTSNFNINNATILGTGYPLGWQYMYLVCYGIKSGDISEDYTTEFFSCTFFNGEGIILPYTLNADYKVSVSFYETSIQTDAAIIGNTLDAIHVHLTENSNKWYTSGGNSLVEMGAWSGNVVHTFVCNNGNSHNEFDGVEKNSYTPTTDNSIYYTVGCRGNNNQAKPWIVALIGYIKWFKIESLSTGDVICELKPCQIKKGNTIIAHGMMDIVNDIFYSNSGMIASNDH